LSPAEDMALALSSFGGRRTFLFLRPLLSFPQDIIKPLVVAFLLLEIFCTKWVVLYV